MDKTKHSNFEKRLLSLAASRAEGALLEMVNYHFKNPGKMLRAKMVLELGDALNAKRQSLIDWALCLELFHNASLIHDDLQDLDAVRRGQASLWALYGESQAINAGDYLLMLSHIPLGKIESLELRERLSKLYSETSLQVVRGQSLEFELNELQRPRDLWHSYLKCVRLKTAAVFSCLAHGVGLISGLPDKECAKLAKIFEILGVIFQIQDDILDLYGNKLRGEQGCDIKEGKVSCLVAKHLELNPADGEKLISLLRASREKTTDAHVEWARSLFVRSGTLQVVLGELGILIESARSSVLIQSNQALADLVKGCIVQILSPIAHLQHYPQEEVRV